MSLSKIKLIKRRWPTWPYVVNIVLDAPFWLVGSLVGSFLGTFWHGFAYGFKDSFETWNQTRKDHEVER